jgi:integration host factor subunit beta
VVKSELVERIAAQKSHLRAHDFEKVVNAILGEIVEVLARGGRVEIRGFGVFSVRTRPPRTGRNPRSGAAVAVSQNLFRFSGPEKKCANASIGQRRDAPTSMLLPEAIFLLMKSRQ